MKHLGDHGYDATLLTRDWGETALPEKGEVEQIHFPITTREELMSKRNFRSIICRKIYTFFYRVNNRLRPTKGFYRPLYEVAKHRLETSPYDLILCTGEPFVLFQIGQRLHHETGVPWVADYRDGWSTDYIAYASSAFKRWKMSWWDRSWEKAVVKSAALITTVSDPVRNDLKKLFPDHKIGVVMNGYEGTIAEQLANIPQHRDHFEIAYSGTLYPYQRLDVFVQGLKMLVAEQDLLSVKVVFYGLPKSSIEEVQSMFSGMEGLLDIRDPLPYDEVMKALKRAHILLLLANEQIDGSCTKVFDYLLLSRRILLCVDDHGTLSHLVKSCHAGMIANSPEEVVSQLKVAIATYQQHGNLEHQTINIEPYSKQHQTGKLVNMLDDIINK